MINDNVKTSLIYNDLNVDDRTNWFDMKRDKFLHNIDTLYYSASLYNDFSLNTDDKDCLAFRKWVLGIYELKSSDDVIPFNIPTCNYQVNVRKFTFGMFYKCCFEVPELFDIFIADKVPNDETPAIIIQIRSKMLWELGAKLSVDRSLNVLKCICDYFSLTIYEVKENRIDYCWHSNYLQNPSQFFRIDNFCDMKVTRYRRIHYEYQLKANDEYEGDYISMGSRGEKCFVRIYLKSKEVVEMGYKSWFFQYWLLNGLINRYDLYIYEKCYEKCNWNYIDMARLEFYIEYGNDKFYKEQCKLVLENKVKLSDDSLSKLADKVTPRITLITNVEFQTMRKSTKSYPIREFKDNSKYSFAKRLYDYLDNRKLITEYLTHETLRLVRTDQNDKNKSRRDYCKFWLALRNTKQVDVYIPKQKLKFVRDYSRILQARVIKKKILHSCTMLNLYLGNYDSDVSDDIASALLTLNDNDIHEMKNYKQKKYFRQNQEINKGGLSIPDGHKFVLVDTVTGEQFDV